MNIGKRKKQETKDRGREREREDQVTLPGHNTINWGKGSIACKASAEQKRRKQAYQKGILM